MKKILLNISFIAALVMMVSSCVDPDPDYKDFPSKDVDFTYAVAPSADGQVEYGMDYYVVSHIQFNNTSFKQGNPTWDFGDGTTSTEQNPVHKFEKAGTYQVKLTIDGVGSRTYPIMIYDIAPVLSIQSQSAETLTINDVNVDFNIFLPNPENKKVKYEWTFPDGTLDEQGNPLTTFVGYADETGKVDYPGKVHFKNVGSQRITLKATFDVDGENRQLEESYVNVQVGADKDYPTLYYATLGGNIKALKLIPDADLPAGSKNLPFDMGVNSGNMPFNLVYYQDADGQGWIYILDAGKQYTYVNDTDGTLGDGKINVMTVDGKSTNLFVTNVGQTAFNDPFFGTVDGTDLIYSDRNTGLRKTALSTRGGKESSTYLVKNDQLGYYSRSISYGAISTTIEKDSKGMYWWGKCYNGTGIFRFKSSDIVSDYKTASEPYKVVLNAVKLKAFTIDETRKALYVWRWQDGDGFYAYPLPGDAETVNKADFTASFSMVADPINSTDAEGVYCTQMALDKETGNVYFGFNKAAADPSAYATGLKYYDPSAKKIVDVAAVTDKILGVVINPNKSKLF